MPAPVITIRKVGHLVAETVAGNPLNPINHGVYISDNLPFLRSLNRSYVDLVSKSFPFAKNETFDPKNAKSPDPPKPTLQDAKRET